MKYTLSSFKFIPSALQAVVLGALATSIIACRTIAADTTPAPTPALSPSPAPKNPAGLVSAPPIEANSGTGGVASSGGISASAGDTASVTIGPGMIARIGDTDIKTDYIRSVIAGLDPAEQEAMASNPVLLKKVVFSLLVEQIMIKEITARQWDQQPEVADHLARVRQTTLADMFLKSISIPPKGYPSTAELQSAYDTHKDAFVVPHQYQISQIFVTFPRGSADKAVTDKARTKLDAILKALKQPGADFATIARTMSDDAKGAAQGGSMGWVPEEKMPPRIRAQAMALPVNIVSDPIMLDDGFHIIKVLDTKDPSPLSFDEVKDKLAQQLRAERTQANMQAFVNKMLEANPVTIDEKVLPTVLEKPDKK